MDESKAHTIVATLANGVDPLTGQAFPADSPYQSADVVRALYIAAQVLDASLRSRARQAQLPANAGKPWSDEEDGRLLAQFDTGQNLQQLARLHARTMAGVQARLERHGRLAAQGSGKRLRSQNTVSAPGGTGRRKGSAQ